MSNSISQSSLAPSIPSVVNPPIISQLPFDNRYSFLQVPTKVVPLLDSLMGIREDTFQINACRAEMEEQRARLKAELRNGPPGLKVPIFWIEGKPEKPIKTAMELFAKKRKELMERVPMQWKRDLDNQAEEQLHEFEMRGQQLFREPIEQINLHKKETLEKLKFPDEIQEIERCTNSIIDNVITCINFAESNQSLLNRLPDQSRHMIQELFRVLVTTHEVYQKSRSIVHKLHSIYFEMMAYRNELISHSRLVKQLKKIGKASIEKTEELNAQKEVLASMKSKFKSALKYIDSIDMHTFAPVGSLNDLYSTIVDLSDDIEQFKLVH